MFRQGDVLILPVKALPRNLKRVLPEGSRYILASGEATGHAHAVAHEGAEMYCAVRDPDETYLKVHSSGCEVVHEEHDPIKLPPGAYRVIRQREYSGREVRYVRD